MSTKKLAICNKCGKGMDEFELSGGIHIYQVMGYGTRHDGDTFEMDLCPDCSCKLIEWCSVDPIVSNY